MTIQEATIICNKRLVELKDEDISFCKDMVYCYENYQQVLSRFINGKYKKNISLILNKYGLQLSDFKKLLKKGLIHKACGLNQMNSVLTEKFEIDLTNLYMGNVNSLFMDENGNTIYNDEVEEITTKGLVSKIALGATNKEIAEEIDRVEEYKQSLIAKMTKNNRTIKESDDIEIIAESSVVDVNNNLTV